MKKYYVIIFFCLTSITLSAQNYLDLVRVTSTHATLGNIDNELETDVSNFQIDALFPYPIAPTTGLIGGFTYENTRLGLQFSDFRTNLVMTRLNVGIKHELKNDWSLTAVVLPKLASDFKDSSGDNFQIGTLALFEKKKNRNKVLRVGSYISTENFGTTITPLVGLWYRSSNKKLIIDAVLPIRGDLNYLLTDSWGVGANLLTSVKSYNLTRETDAFYIQEESIRFALTTSYGFLDGSLIVKAKVGFDTTDYGLYEQNDKVGAQVLTFQVSGDDRNRLNAEFDSGLFFGGDIIYRLPL